MDSKEYRWLFLDLSHGLNYLLVAVLYATIANAIVFDMESRLIVINSEPAVAGGAKCVSGRDMGSEIQKYSIELLNMLDVSRLQKIIFL